MNEKHFYEQYINHLNPQQQEAVRTVDGATLLLAVPGSGKTTVLINRLGYMVCCKDIAPSSILTMTYTVAATGEMRERFSELFGKDYAKSLEFRTINGLSQKIIDYYSSNYSARAAFDLESDESITYKRIGQIYLDVNKDYAPDSLIKDIRTIITYIKNMMLTDEEIDRLQTGIDNMPAIYRRYCDTMKKLGRMDYDDQMAYALMILRKYPEILDHFQERYKYICVDEAQDTSKIQHEIIKLLAKKYGNIFMVGDEDQSIYGFRAAYPEALLEFEKTYPNAKTLLIEQNYRSSSEIVSAANAFVVKNRFRHEKQIRQTRGEVCPVRVIEALSREYQIKYLLAAARKCENQTAVLYRNNESALPLIDLLERNGIGYNCRRFDMTFFSHPIVSDVADIIRFAHNMSDADTFLRIYYKLGAPITKPAATYAAELCRQKGTPLLQAVLRFPELAPYAENKVRELNANLSLIPELSALEAIRVIFDVIGYGKHAADKDPESTKRETLQLLAKNVAAPLDLLRRLDELQKIVQEHRNAPENLFFLSTIHSSKGLEYERVFLLDVFDGILPSKPFPDAHDSDAIKLYEEERRLYYVAMTRAKNELCLFRCKGSNSAFTDEIVRKLPRAYAGSDSIWAVLPQNFCGMSLVHKAYGKGTVRACSGMLLMVEFETGKTVLATISELFENRKLEIAEEPPPSIRGKTPVSQRREPTSPPPIGSRITHAVFGEGIVTEYKNGIISIKFGKQETRKFDFYNAASSGKLYI